MFIFFITGASGTGKTTLIGNLKKKFQQNPNWTFLHFDSIGVPSPEEMEREFGSGENWQKETTFKWIEKMLLEYQETEFIVFEGQVNLKFIKDGFEKNNFSDYEIILVDCNEKIMEERLNKRNQPELFTDDMKNWLLFLRKQANNYNAKIIDTSSKSESEVVKSFEDILEKFT
ncbi:MAG: AAA family ATPase [Minisyncoccales bacterium]